MAKYGCQLSGLSLPARPGSGSGWLAVGCQADCREFIVIIRTTQHNTGQVSWYVVCCDTVSIKHSVVIPVVLISCAVLCIWSVVFCVMKCGGKPTL